MDKSERRGFVLGVLSGVTGNAIYQVIGLLMSGAVLGSIAAWVQSLTDLERGIGYTLAAESLIAAGLVAMRRDHRHASPRLKIDSTYHNGTAYLSVHNLGTPIVVHALIHPHAGVEGWPIGQVVVKWDGGTGAKRIYVDQGETRRIIVGTISREKKSNADSFQWTIYGFRRRKRLELSAPWNGGIRISVTLVVDRPATSAAIDSLIILQGDRVFLNPRESF